MVVIPAIDLYCGKVVRMIRGNKHEAIHYDYHPVKLIEKFVDSGLELVHVVDLSRAIDNSDDNLKILDEISKRGLAKYVELGGGIRSSEYSLYLREMGFKRQIITSMIVKKPEMIPKLLSNDVEVIFGLDTLGKDTIKFFGWKDSKTLNVFEFLYLIKEMGIQEIIHTDISVDGTLKNRSFDLTLNIIVNTSLNTIVAGGISSFDDIEKARKIAGNHPLLKGIIIGRAFFEGRISIEEMVRYAG